MVVVVVVMMMMMMTTTMMVMMTVMMMVLMMLLLTATMPFSPLLHLQPTLAALRSRDFISHGGRWGTSLLHSAAAADRCTTLAQLLRWSDREIVHLKDNHGHRPHDVAVACGLFEHASMLHCFSQVCDLVFWVLGMGFRV